LRGRAGAPPVTPSVSEVAREPASLTPGDPEASTDGVPSEVFARLRREAPVAWIDEPARPERNLAAGPGFWAVTRHADVDAVSRQPATVSSWQGSSFLRLPRTPVVSPTGQWMLHIDSPAHTHR